MLWTAVQDPLQRVSTPAYDVEIFLVEVWREVYALIWLLLHHPELCISVLTAAALPPILMDMDIADVAVIYQDHHLLIINKPAGVVIHPSYKHADGTLWDALLVFLAQQQQDDWRPPELPDDPRWERAPEHVRVMLRQQRLQRLWKEEGLLPRPCLLHRLDKDTSGVVALARTARSCRHFGRQFYEHSTIKRYLAVVTMEAPDWARPRTAFQVLRRTADGGEEAAQKTQLFSASADEEFVLNGPLGRDSEDRRRSIVIASGLSSTTLVRTLAVEQNLALLDVQPVTGRTHQIRAHLAALGCAIVGDHTYGVPGLPGTMEAALPRQFLHAYSLTLHYYAGNAVQTFLAPLAFDLVRWLACYCPLLLDVASSQIQVSH